MAARKPAISLADAKIQLEASVRARLEKDLARRMSSDIVGKTETADYLLRRALERVESEALSRILGNSSTLKSEFPPLKNLQQAVEDRVVQEVTLQILKLSESPDLQKQIQAKVESMIESAIERRCYEIADKYVKRLVDKYEVEKVLFAEETSPESSDK